MTLAEKLSNTPFVLSLSSGFFGFFAHCGFVKALWDERLRPKLVTGSSAGAIVAACLASGMQPSELERELLGLTQDHYWDPKFGFGFLKGERFEQTLCSFVIPEMDKAQIPIQISCFNIKKRKTEIFEQGPLAKIVRASCAVPLFFHPVRIEQDYYWDGGIQDKMGIFGVAKEDLILGHCLPASRLTEWYETRALRQFPNQHVLQISGLPFTGPNHFANAPKAIAIAYEETKRLLAREA